MGNMKKGKTNFSEYEEYLKISKNNEILSLKTAFYQIKKFASI
jgi:hypothetical protein